jgi:hypothetical protein
MENDVLGFYTSPTITDGTSEALPEKAQINSEH